MRDILDEIRKGTFRLSQSRMKKLLSDNPRTFLNTKRSEDSRDSIIGRMTETLALEGYGVWENKFICLDGHMPVASIKAVLDKLFSILNNGEPINTELKTHLRELQKACIECNYQPRWSMDVRVSKILLDAPYFELLVEAENKVIVSSEEFEESTLLATSFLTSDATVSYFNDSCIRLPQLKLYFDYRGIKCMGILDFLQIIPKKKTMRVVDMKTTTLPIRSAAAKTRWDLQGTFYNLAVDACRSEISNILGMNVSDFKLDNPEFIVVQRYNIGAPKVLRLSDTDIKIALEGAMSRQRMKVGRVLREQERSICGINELIDRFRHYSETEKWDYPLEYLNGKRPLNLWATY